MQIGALEKLVLQYLWANHEGDAKQVHASIVRQGERSLNTVQSALDRLYKKGLLSREKRGHAFVYLPKISRDDLIAQLITNVTDDFVSEGENGLIAAFSSASNELDNDQLDKLEKMIEAQRARRNGS